MAVYTYDEQADTLYILLSSESEARIERTIEASDRLHMDVGPDGTLIGVENLYPKLGQVDLAPVKER